MEIKANQKSLLLLCRAGVPYLNTHKRAREVPLNEVKNLLNKRREIKEIFARSRFTTPLHT